MKKAKVVMILVGLLVLLAAANYAFNMDPTQLAARGVGRDSHGGDQTRDERPVAAITPLGPEGAPVTIEVFHMGEASCRESFWPIMTAVNATYADHVRINFSDLTNPEVSQRAREMTLRGGTGLTINGEAIVKAPGAGAFDTVVFSGSPQDQSWNPGMLDMVIQAELAARDIKFDPPARQRPPPGDGHNH